MRPALLTLVVALAAVAAGCGAVGRVTSGDAGQGKTLFKANCGACHTLADAGTKGAVGPNLDAAFASDKQQGFKEQTIRDVIRGQIAYADPNTGTGVKGVPTPGMPANIVRGQQARDVAFYVAKCAAVPKCGVNAGG